MHLLDLAGRRARHSWTVLRRQREYLYGGSTAPAAAPPPPTAPRGSTATLHLWLGCLRVCPPAAVRRNRHDCCMRSCPVGFEWLEASCGGIEDPGFARYAPAETAGLCRYGHRPRQAPVAQESRVADARPPLRRLPLGSPPTSAPPPPP